MDPLNGVLDEKFFMRASPECMQALAGLIDDKLASRFQEYLKQAASDNPVKSKIEVYLGKAIRRALFAVELEKTGYASMVESLDLLHIAYAPLESLTDMYKAFSYLEQNFDYIKTTTNIRTKTMYDKFYSLLPMGGITLPNGRTRKYSDVVKANKAAFYQQRETHRRSYAASVVCKRRTAWTIARKGIEYRMYCNNKGIDMCGPQAVRF